MQSAHIPNFDNSYARLPEHFYSRQDPQPAPDPSLIRVNRVLADTLGFDPAWLESEQGLAFCVGNYLPATADPIATVYAGHQFGGWSRRLGDGRALLLGEVIAGDGQRYDIQLKGSGRTPYSRGGDGRSPLGPVLREYIVSEAMAALGVPTTRALAAASTGEIVVREEQLPGAVLVRVAKSHIRIGTVQYFAARKDTDSLRILVDHVIQRHYPDAAQADNPARALLDSVIAAQASLVAKWQALGFIHGVMNTDNILLSGDTIDYGPCAFMDGFDVNAVYSSIDRDGRYAYSNQPGIAHWNLAQLTQALLPLIDEDENKALASGQDAIDAFPELYRAENQRNMRTKLGLANEHAEDAGLIQDLMVLMQDSSVDYTLFFRRLSDMANQNRLESKGVGSIFELPESFAPWLGRWELRLTEEGEEIDRVAAGMLKVNPVFIPRNHLVEEAIEAATNEHNFGPFNALVDLLGKPFEFDRAKLQFALPPNPEQVVKHTFCGT